MNSLVIDGRLGRSAELKDVGGNQLLSFSVANNTGYGDNKATTWFNCALWGKRGASIEQYMQKGQHVIVSGELSERKYNAKDGTEKTSLEIRVNDVTLVGKADSSEAPAPKQEESSADMPF